MYQYGFFIPYYSKILVIGENWVRGTWKFCTIFPNFSESKTPLKNEVYLKNNLNEVPCT